MSENTMPALAQQLVEAGKKHAIQVLHQEAKITWRWVHLPQTGSSQKIEREHMKVVDLGGGIFLTKFGIGLQGRDGIFNPRYVFVARPERLQTEDERVVQKALRKLEDIVERNQRPFRSSLSVTTA